MASVVRKIANKISYRSKTKEYDPRNETLSHLLVYGFIRQIITEYELDTQYMIPTVISKIIFNDYYIKYCDSLFILLSNKELRVAQINYTTKIGQNTLLCDKCRWISGHRVVYCLGKNISYNAAKTIGFNKPNSINNQIIFKCAKGENISAYNISSNESIIFSELFIDYQRAAFTYSNKHGLIVVGGETPYGSSILDIKQCMFEENDSNNALVTMKTIAKLPYPTGWSSLAFVEEDKLGIFGGWWDGRDSKLCYMLDLNTYNLMNIKTMNFKHQLGGIYHWKCRNKMLIIGGFNRRKECEEYDILKDKWIELPMLNKCHNRYPCVTQLNEFGNEVIVCMGGVTMDDRGLGCIEILDYRENKLKWKYINTVQQYFNLPKVNGGGYNCFLPS